MAPSISFSLPPAAAMALKARVPQLRAAVVWPALPSSSARVAQQPRAVVVAVAALPTAAAEVLPGAAAAPAEEV
jgi:hypothetical protein